MQNRKSNFLRTQKRPAAFTLLELVLVIAVLAILATIAVTSLTGVQDQSRFDVTQRQLSNIQSAIDGDPGLKHPDGSNIPNGFVADMGRLPAVLFQTDPTTSLQELWIQPTSVATYGIKSPTTSPDQDIQIGTGWRGPYLQLPIGAQQLADGWGHSYVFNGTPTATADTPLTSVQSLGSDNAIGSTTGDIYAADLPATPLPFSSTEYSTTVTCIVSSSSASPPPLSAKLFQPDGLGGIATVLVTPSTVNGVTTITFTGVSPGSRVIRTYSDAGSTLPLSTQYITVPKGGLVIATPATATSQPSSTSGT